MALVDDLIATRDALVAQRLAMVRAGPSPDMSVHHYNYQLGRYMKEMDGRIDALTRQIAQNEIVEVVSRARV